jgi:cytochrome d ubiquinol oxidase subunit I
MSDALLLHRIHFAFTVTYHYLFPQLTMGLALLIVILKTIAIRKNDPVYDDAARFWARIFGINFIMGVVTGIPMEFQFGTNWAQFSRMTGGVIGISRPLPLRRKAPFPLATLVGGLPGLCRLLDFRLLHHRHRCLDATPGRVSRAGQWIL